jgi:predicted nucleic acid-binding protein
LIVYADTSFFLSLYVKDANSRDAIVRASVHPSLALTPLHLAEWANAVSALVFRNTLTRAEADDTFDEFEQDRRIGLWAHAELPEASFQRAVHLARNYVPLTGTRALDTLHVACALELGAQEFWTFDDRQAQLAQAVGLKT